MELEFLSDLTNQLSDSSLSPVLATLLSESAVPARLIEQLYALHLSGVVSPLYMAIWRNPYHPLIPNHQILSEQAISYEMYRIALSEARRLLGDLRYDFDPVNSELRRALEDSGYTLVRRTAIVECVFDSIRITPCADTSKIEQLSSPLSPSDITLLCDYYRACHAPVSPFDPERSNDELITLLIEDLDAQHSYRLLEGDKHILWTTATQDESAELLYLAGNRGALEDGGFCRRFFLAVLGQLARESREFIAEFDDTDPLAVQLMGLMAEAPESYWECWMTGQGSST